MLALTITFGVLISNKEANAVKTEYTGLVITDKYTRKDGAKHPVYFYIQAENSLVSFKQLQVSEDTFYRLHLNDKMDIIRNETFNKLDSITCIYKMR